MPFDLQAKGCKMLFFAGLSPKDSFQIAQCDMIVDSLNDVYTKLYAFVFSEKDEEKKVPNNVEKYFELWPKMFAKIKID